MTSPSRDALVRAAKDYLALAAKTPTDRDAAFEIGLINEVSLIRDLLALVEREAGYGSVTLQYRISVLVQRHGSMRKAARILQTDAGYLSRLYSGEKNNPSSQLLRRMGLKRSSFYDQVKP